MNEQTADLTVLPPHVEIDVTERVTDAEVAKAMQSQGIELGIETLRSLRAVGIYVRGQGITHTQYGRAIINTGRADAILARLSEMIADFSSKRMSKKTGNPKAMALLTQHVKAFTELYKAVTDNQEFVRKLGGVAAVPIAAEDEEPRQNKSFKPGTVVVAQTAHIHESNKDLPKQG